MYKNTDMSVADMALELAESDFHTLLVSDLLELAAKQLDAQWLEKAQDNPRYVIDTYEIEIGRYK